MSAALLAALACCAAGIGARDQMLVAALSARLGRHTGLLMLALLAAALTSALAAGAGQAMAAFITYPARCALSALALAVAGLSALLLHPKAAPKEPTRSLFAATLALVMLQTLDSARWLVLAIALLADDGRIVAAGGALGSGLALLLGWLAGGAMLRKGAALAAWRRWAGVAGLAVAGMMALFMLMPGDR